MPQGSPLSYTAAGQLYDQLMQCRRQKEQLKRVGAQLLQTMRSNSWLVERWASNPDLEPASWWDDEDRQVLQALREAERHFEGTT